MLEYRKISYNEINKELFAYFVRRQVVTKCYRKIDGEWVIKDAPFIDDWSPENYDTLVKCLRNTAYTGGFFYGAFACGKLKGFTSVEAEPIGKNREYLDLSCIHVSAEMRGTGIGKKLFEAAKRWAKEHGAKKLYISAHSAVETQAFYKALGCVEALEYNKEHAEAEPFDCQMECLL